MLGERGLVRNPLVEVDTEGMIRRVDTCDAPDALERTEFYPGLLVPGLVNAHTHLELSYLKGRIPRGGGFAAFARALRRERQASTEDERLRAAEAADAHMWVEGTSAAGDHCNGEDSFRAKAGSRIVYRSFAEVYGLKTPSAERTRTLLRHPLTVLTPHAFYSLQEAVLREACAAGDGPLSIHLLETPAEKELFHGRGALYAWIREQGLSCDFLASGSPVERLIRTVPRERSVILVHACCLEQQDIDRIMDHFTAPVYWCLCPRSNGRISGLRPPVELMRSNGLDLCAGTDSLASNDDLNVLEELKQFPDIPLAELLGWATRGGARALGFDHLGRIAPGTRPGLAVIAPLHYAKPALLPASRIRRIV